MAGPDSTNAQEQGCCCSALSDMAVVPMGGDGLDERVLATLETMCDHGGIQWWLYLSRCSACGQNWMVAQEERIFDIFLLRRLDAAIADQIVAEGRWPAEFLTYEAVLKISSAVSTPFVFLEALSPSLVWTAQDLRKERPDITVEEIALLTGVSPAHAARLLAG